MSDIVKMSVEPRPGIGKGAARAARRAGYVPGVIYGDKKDPVTIQIRRNELLKTLQKGGFYTTLFDIDVDGTKNRVIAKDIQKNKLNGLPEHVDFMRLAKGAKVVINVPVHFIDEEKCEGLERGGTLNIVRHEVELSVAADNMPDAIECSLEGFDIGDSVHISAANMPEGATPTITDRDFTIATIVQPSAMASAEDEETDETEGEDGEAEKGTEASAEDAGGEETTS